MNNNQILDVQTFTYLFHREKVTLINQQTKKLLDYKNHTPPRLHISENNCIRRRASAKTMERMRMKYLREDIETEPCLAD